SRVEAVRDLVLRRHPEAAGGMLEPTLPAFPWRHASSPATHSGIRSASSATGAVLTAPAVLACPSEPHGPRRRRGLFIERWRCVASPAGTAKDRRNNRAIRSAHASPARPVSAAAAASPCFAAWHPRRSVPQPPHRASPVAPSAAARRKSA